MSIFDQQFTINNLLFKSETNLIKNQSLKEQYLYKVFSSIDYEPCQEISVQSAINSLYFDSTSKFLITSDCEGFASIFEVQEQSNGNVKLLNKRQFLASVLHKGQWYPVDNGLFSIIYPSKIFFIDSHRYKAIDSYDFGLKRIYDSDWNILNPNLVAVGTSSSAIRFIDIRTGNFIQQINVESCLGHSLHNVTRVLWSSLDEEALFAGDSSGFIHVFDIRIPKKSLQSIENDSTICEPVVSLSHTPDHMKIISCHGRFNKATQWIFKNKHFENANINYPNPYPRDCKKGKSSSMQISEFLRCQIFLTESLLIKPIFGNAGEIIIHDIKTGQKIRILSSSTWSPFNKYGASCVTGLYKDYFVLFTGTRRFLKVWRLKNSEKGLNNSLYQDNWSDSE